MCHPGSGGWRCKQPRARVWEAQLWDDGGQQQENSHRFKVERPGQVLYNTERWIERFHLFALLFIVVVQTMKEYSWKEGNSRPLPNKNILKKPAAWLREIQCECCPSIYCCWKKRSIHYFKFGQLSILSQILSFSCNGSALFEFRYKFAVELFCGLGKSMAGSIWTMRVDWI